MQLFNTQGAHLRHPGIIALLVGISLFFGACAMMPLAPASESSPPHAETSADAPAPTATRPDTQLLDPQDPPRSLTASPWATDFSRRTVEWTEIRSGGPPKDGIPPIDTPEFESVATAGNWLSARDPVIVLQVGEEVRAYPLAILMWHEIVNDEVGGVPVAVTFCPLCNASIVFARTFDGQVLDFGTTGLLRNSDLVMYDRQTETWWQQFTGEGLVGQYAGERLDFLAAQVISYGDFAQRFPTAQMLARPTSGRAYGMNPYTQYDSTTGAPFLFDGELDERLPTMERVVGLVDGERALAVPFVTASAEQVINLEFAASDLVIMHSPGTASALDTQEISAGRDVGSIGVFSRQVGDQILTFVADAETDTETDTETSNPANSESSTFLDEETGSRWSHLGLAIEGELAGTQLEQVLAFDHFWFAWAAFFPTTAIYE